MNIRLLLTAFFLLVCTQQEIFSQATHELGVVFGPVALYSDYGERNNFETNMGNTGLGYGVVHFLNFSYGRYSFFNDHFKLRNEVNFYKTNLQHYGQWVSPEKTSLFSDQLRAMSGSTSVFEIGSQLEYFPLSIKDFEYKMFPIAPFIGLGIHWVSFNPEAKSSMGTLNSIATTPEKYRNGFQNEAGSTFALVGSLGMRYKLTQMSDLMLDLRWHYYFSDWVDGLNPSFENNGTLRVPENKSNDWMFWLNLGYIVYLN